MKDIFREVEECLNNNKNKLTPGFIDEQVDKGQVEYFQLTPCMRVCVIVLASGHEVIGVAQVLSESNDVESIGNSVAYANAKSELWKTLGSIAKAVR